MSTFLQLCQDLREEAGITGSGPVSVSGQTGEMLRIINWIKKAYRDVQNLHSNWDFLCNDFSFPTIADTSTYAITAVSLDELASWKKGSVRAYLTATGVSDEQYLRQWDWDDFRDAYVFANSRTQTGKPTDFAIKPDKTIVFWPVPNAVYTVVGEYFKRAQSLSANSDEPLFPDEYHDILKWRGLMYYGAHEGATEVYAFAKDEYQRMLSELRRDQLPPIRIGGALA